MLEINKVYCMDCLEGMKLIDDKSIDLIVTDPPLKATVAVPVVAVTATIDPPAVPVGLLTSPAPAWLKLTSLPPEIVTAALPSDEVTTMTEPPALIPSLVAAMFPVMLELLIVTVVEA